jgi:hypothetical protein
MEPPNLKTLGRKTGEWVRTWTCCIIEFMEGFQEGVGDLEALNKKLTEVTTPKKAD